jgi:SAM-dependent methyltransferase
VSRPLYDEIGRTYARTRRPDARIARRIAEALDDAISVLNVGAGAGSYEPGGRRVVAVEPSPEMIRQRPSGAGPAVRAVAEDLPFADASFEAVMGTLTVHHWRDPLRGLAEVRRVASDRVVIMTMLRERFSGFWLTDEYFPEILDMDADTFPTLAEMESVLGPVRIEAIGVPHDCTDGFLAAYWRRPEAYLREEVQAGISGIARQPKALRRERIERLRSDLESGEWDRRWGHLRELDEIDVGYSLLVAEPPLG